MIWSMIWPRKWAVIHYSIFLGSKIIICIVIIFCFVLNLVLNGEFIGRQHSSCEWTYHHDSMYNTPNRKKTCDDVDWWKLSRVLEPTPRQSISSLSTKNEAEHLMIQYIAPYCEGNQKPIFKYSTTFILPLQYCISNLFLHAILKCHMLKISLKTLYHGYPQVVININTTLFTAKAVKPVTLKCMNQFYIKIS